MQFQYLLYEKKERVAWITINRPDARNALSDAVRDEIVEALYEARDDEEVHIIAITGAGDKAFSAGADISEFPKFTAPDNFKKHSKPHPVVVMRQVHKPVVAMVNGLALGGGCELVLASDIAIAAESAKFGQPEINIGIIPGSGGTQILPRLIGEKRAKEMVFTGRAITAEEALKFGIVNKVVPQEKLRETTEELIAELLKKSPVILQIAKMSLNRAMETTLTGGLETERDFFALCFSTQDQKEGVRAFLEKRTPDYQGK